MNDQFVGVLMMAYGGPNSLDEVSAYLADIRGGRPTPPELLAEITERYRRIGGRSPILEHTRAQAAGVESALNDAAAAGDGLHFRTWVGMRHWHPYIGDVVPEMLAAGVDRIVAIVMAPHFSRMSVGAYIGKLDKALADAGSDVPVARVESWKSEPAFIDAVAQRVIDALEAYPADVRPYVPIVFTAHSLPARVLESGDPYPDELNESVRQIVECVRPSDWRFAFQSQGATADPWLGPSVEETLENIASEGHRHVLLVPIGFVCDHVEVLYDIDIEHAQQAAELGIELRRTEMLNASPGLVTAVAGAVHAALLAPAPTK